MEKILLDKIKTEGFSEALQAEIIAFNDPEIAYRFAYALPESDLPLLEAVIIGSEVPRFAYDFALIKAERGGTVERLQERVIQSADGGLMVLFAADVEGADIDAMEAALEALPDAKYLNLFHAEMRQKGF